MIEIKIQVLGVNLISLHRKERYLNSNACMHRDLNMHVILI